MTESIQLEHVISKNYAKKINKENMDSLKYDKKHARQTFFFIYKKGKKKETEFVFFHQCEKQWAKIIIHFCNCTVLYPGNDALAGKREEIKNKM